MGIMMSKSDVIKGICSWRFTAADVGYDVRNTSRLPFNSVA